MGRNHKLLSGVLIVGVLAMAGVAAASVLSGGGSSSPSTTVKTGRALGKA